MAAAPMCPLTASAVGAVIARGRRFVMLVPAGWSGGAAGNIQTPAGIVCRGYLPTVVGFGVPVGGSTAVDSLMNQGAEVRQPWSASISPGWSQANRPGRINRRLSSRGLVQRRGRHINGAYVVLYRGPTQEVTRFARSRSSRSR